MQRKFRCKPHFLFKGMFLEKSTKLYAKVTLLENNKELASKKLWSSNNKKMFTFSKELIFKLNGKNPENCSLQIHLKKQAGYGFKSK